MFIKYSDVGWTPPLYREYIGLEISSSGLEYRRIHLSTVLDMHHLRVHRNKIAPLDDIATAENSNTHAGKTKM